MANILGNFFGLWVTSAGMVHLVSFILVIDFDIFPDLEIKEERRASTDIFFILPLA